MRTGKRAKRGMTEEQRAFKDGMLDAFRGTAFLNRRREWGDQVILEVVLKMTLFDARLPGRAGAKLSHTKRSTP